MKQKVTIGLIPRERFSLASEAIQTIYEHTTIPFDLVIVDCNIPEKYLAQINHVLLGRRNFQIIHSDHYLLPGQSRNLVLSAMTGEYICFIDNDVLVTPNWLDAMMDTMAAFNADVVTPVIAEGNPDQRRDLHFDDKLGSVEHIETIDGPKLRILEREQSEDYGFNSESRVVQFVEEHCVLFRSDVFDRIGPYDGDLHVRGEVNLSLALYKADSVIVFEPKSLVHFVPPFPPEAEELEFFRMRWDVQGARRSCARIQERWQLAEPLGGNMEFAKDRQLIGSMHALRDDLRALLPANSCVILVDDDRWSGAEIDMLHGLDKTPFTENHSEYWGPPADDLAAITELERLSRLGATHVVFAWSSFWYFEYYTGFHSYGSTALELGV